MQVIINLFMIPDFWLSLVLQGIQEINFLRNREFINLATLCVTSKVLSFILDGAESYIDGYHSPCYKSHKGDVPFC